MIALNLLSPNQKEALRARVIYAMIERLMIAFVGSLLMASIMLLLIKIELTDNLGQVQTRQILSAQYVTVNNDVRQLNQAITRIEALQKMAASPTALLLEIARLTPPGVAVTGLDFDMRSKNLRLFGIAAKREDLLAYEAALRGSAFIEKLDSPISNLFEKTDINFEFKIVLNVETMRRAYEPTP